MPAFNARLKPKEIAGMPMLAAIGLLGTLIFGVLSLMLPWVLRFFTIPLACLGVIAAALAFYFGDELQWLDVMRLGRFVETNRFSSEISEEEK